MNDLVKESIDFISLNPTAKFDEIPLKLLNSWTYEGDLNKPNESSDSWTVFLFALVHYRHKQGLESFYITVEEMIKTFQDWQILIHAAIVSLMTDIKIKPFPMFDFDNIEKTELHVIFPANVPPFG